MPPKSRGSCARLVVFRWSFDDPALSHAKEANVKVIETLALWSRRGFDGAVGFTERAFFLNRDASKTVVGRIAENDKNLGLAFHAVGGVTLGSEFWEEEGLGLLGWHPAGESIGEEDSSPFSFVVIQSAIPTLKQKIDL